MTIACVAGFFIELTTHLMFSQWAKQRQLDLVRVAPNRSHSIVPAGYVGYQSKVLK